MLLGEVVISWLSIRRLAYVAQDIYRVRYGLELTDVSTTSVLAQVIGHHTYLLKQLGFPNGVVA